MTFKAKIEQQLRQAVHGSVEKNILRVLVGEMQKEESKPANAKKELPEKWYINLVNKLISDNTETLGYLRKGGGAEAVERLEEENLVLEALLPEDTTIYWSQDDIRNWIKDEKIDFGNFKSSGQAIGACMSRLKGMDVLGEDVRAVVEEAMAHASGKV